MISNLKITLIIIMIFGIGIGLCIAIGQPIQIKPDIKLVTFGTIVSKVERLEHEVKELKNWKKSIFTMEVNTIHAGKLYTK